MFPSYPDEWPGTGLLLLRVAVGAVLMTRGASFLLGWRHATFAAAIIAGIAVGCATLLLTGYFTRVAASMVTLTCICSTLFWDSMPSADLFSTKLAAALVGVIAGALACLGPGAFSLDARLFGRREIVFQNGKPTR